MIKEECRSCNVILLVKEMVYMFEKGVHRYGE